MDFRGKFDHGVVRPTEPVTLPEGTEVECRTLGPTNGTNVPGLGRDGFWDSRSIEDLGREQRTPLHSTPADLRGDWPREEGIDEFLEFLNKARR